MPQVPFPHVLTFPNPASNLPHGEVARIVSPELKIDDEYNFNVIIGKDIRSKTFVVTEILLERKGKDNWTNWEQVPNYYECKMIIKPE